MIIFCQIKWKKIVNLLWREPFQHRLRNFVLNSIILPHIYPSFQYLLSYIASVTPPLLQLLHIIHMYSP